MNFALTTYNFCDETGLHKWCIKWWCSGLEGNKIDIIKRRACLCSTIFHSKLKETWAHNLLTKKSESQWICNSSSTYKKQQLLPWNHLQKWVMSCFVIKISVWWQFWESKKINDIKTLICRVEETFKMQKSLKLKFVPSKLTSFFILVSKQGQTFFYHSVLYQLMLAFIKCWWIIQGPWERDQVRRQEAERKRQVAHQTSGP